MDESTPHERALRVLGIVGSVRRESDNRRLLAAADTFDQGGALVHEPTRTFLAAFLRELRAWTIRPAPAAL